MPAFILHRSLKSPYAQKIMLFLGYLNQDYLSFIAPKGIPRPIEEALVGEYSRRIPILQIGADIYCDSELILRVMAEKSQADSLFDYPSDEEALQWTTRIERHGNEALVASITPLEMIFAYFKNMPPNQAWKFITDRIKLAKALPAPTPKLTQHEKVEAAQAYLQELDRQLSEQQYMLTESHPTAVDFAAFTMIYYHDTINGLKHANRLIHLARWYKKMSDIGTGKFDEIKGEECLRAARESSPAAIDERYLSSPRIGQTVSYRNRGFMEAMNDAVEGVIVGEDDDTIILRRENSTVGVVHVHFPKLKY